MRLAAALLLVAALTAGCEPVTGPEGAIAQQLVRLQEAARFPLAGATLEVRRLRFDRVLVKPEAGAYTAVASVDLEGSWQGVPLSYLGLERIPFARGEGGWRPAVAMPALAQILAALQERRGALARADLAALQALLAQSWSDGRLTRAAMLDAVRERLGQGGPPERVLRWTVRAERERAEVLEEVSAGGPGPSLRSRFELVREGARFRFAAGLM